MPYIYDDLSRAKWYWPITRQFGYGVVVLIVLWAVCYAST